LKIGAVNVENKGKVVQARQKSLACAAWDFEKVGSLIPSSHKIRIKITVFMFINQNSYKRITRHQTKV
jgi:hypothetical protein